MDFKEDVVSNNFELKTEPLQRLRGIYLSMTVGVYGFIPFTREKDWGSQPYLTGRSASKPKTVHFYGVDVPKADAHKALVIIELKTSLRRGESVRRTVLDLTIDHQRPSKDR